MELNCDVNAADLTVRVTAPSSSENSCDRTSTNWRWLNRQNRRASSAAFSSANAKTHNTFTDENTGNPTSRPCCSVYLSSLKKGKNGNELRRNKKHMQHTCCGLRSPGAGHYRRLLRRQGRTGPNGDTAKHCAQESGSALQDPCQGRVFTFGLGSSSRPRANRKRNGTRQRRQRTICQSRIVRTSSKG